jgi:phosphate transport system substrate-binding protein
MRFHKADHFISVKFALQKGVPMLKQWRVAFMLLAIVALGTLISACGGDSGSTTTTTSSTPTTSSGQQSSAPGFNCVAGSITASGSTALQPYVDAVAKAYQAKCSSAKITVLPGGSKKGLADAENGASQIGNSDVPATTAQADLVDHQVAVVIFVMIVNPDVKLTDLKTADIQGIYEGKISNWSQVGGPNLPISVVSRPATSGTRATFKKFMLDNKNETPAQAKNLTVDSTGTVVQTVEQTSGSIGYVALGGAQSAGSKVTVTKIDGKDPTEANVKTNDYKFWNIEHMYTKGQASGLAQAFLSYMLTEDALKISDSLAFVRITNVPQDVLTTHNK